MVRGAGAAKITQQLGNCVLGSTCHPNRGANRAALNQAIDNLGAGFGVQAVHNDSYTKAALACQGFSVIFLRSYERNRPVVSSSNCI
jgi:hypothetical protein